MEYRKEITCHYKFKKYNPQNGRKAFPQKNKSKGPCCALGHYFWISRAVFFARPISRDDFAPAHCAPIRTELE
jgi:hypothetical protein